MYNWANQSIQTFAEYIWVRTIQWAWRGSTKFLILFACHSSSLSGITIILLIQESKSNFFWFHGLINCEEINCNPKAGEFTILSATHNSASWNSTFSTSFTHKLNWSLNTLWYGDKTFPVASGLIGSCGSISLTSNLDWQQTKQIV